MIYGIEETTDSRFPETKVVKFTSRTRAIAWAKTDQGFAWSGAARNDIPSVQQNWHRRLRAVYEVKDRRPSKAYFDREYEKWRRWRGSDRPPNFEASWIRSCGERIEE